MKDYKEGDDSAITDSWDKVQSELVSKIMVYFRLLQVYQICAQSMVNSHSSKTDNFSLMHAVQLQQSNALATQIMAPDIEHDL